jgi:hypothetical protein
MPNNANNNNNNNKNNNGVHNWVKKRSTREERKPVTRDIVIIIFQ